MFPSVDLLDESNIHSKDVSSWVGFMSYTSFAIRQRKWFTEIRKNAEHTGKRENIENPLEQCRRQKIAGLKILMVVTRANNRRLRHFGTQPCPIWPIIINIQQISSVAHTVGKFWKCNAWSTLWLEHSNDLGFSGCSLYFATLARIIVFMCCLNRQL